VLAAREKTLGDDDDLTMETLLILAVIYSSLGKMSEALGLRWRRLAVFEKGVAYNEEFLEAISSVAYHAWQVGRMEESHAMFRRALEGFKRTTGCNKDIKQSVVNLFVAFCKSQGKDAEAEAVMQSMEN